MSIDILQDLQNNNTLIVLDLREIPLFYHQSSYYQQLFENISDGNISDENIDIPSPNELIENELIENKEDIESQIIKTNKENTLNNYQITIEANKYLDQHTLTRIFQPSSLSTKSIHSRKYSSFPQSSSDNTTTFSSDQNQSVTNQMNSIDIHDFFHFFSICDFWGIDLLPQEILTRYDHLSKDTRQFIITLLKTFDIPSNDHENQPINEQNDESHEQNNESHEENELNKQLMYEIKNKYRIGYEYQQELINKLTCMFTCFQERTSHLAAELGYLDILQYVVEHDCEISWETTSNAASNGHFLCLQYLYSKKCPMDEYTCEYAAYGGHLSCLQYAHEMKCPWDERTCFYAAAKGQLICLQYAHEHGCPWDANTCSEAALGGHLNCLQYAHEHGCPWNARTCITAASKGRIECLQYAHEHGCPWDSLTIQNAAANGHLNCLQYAYEHGCPWDENASLLAIRNDHVECVKYAKSQGKY